MPSLLRPHKLRRSVQVNDPALVLKRDQRRPPAAAEIERISPSNAELRVWASESNPPKDLDQQQEDRPW